LTSNPVEGADDHAMVARIADHDAVDVRVVPHEGLDAGEAARVLVPVEQHEETAGGCRSVCTGS
jgi:hypothetical protein